MAATSEALAEALEVVNAAVEAVSRVDGRGDLWEIRLTRASDAVVSVRLSPAVDCAAAGAVCTEDGRTLAHSVGTAVAGPPPAAGGPVITGVVRVGETLAVDTSGIVDVDGVAGAVFGYQWVRGDGGSDTDIAGAVGAAYTLTDDDEGHTITVEVSFVDDAGNPETVTSDPTAAVEPDAPPHAPLFYSEEVTEAGVELVWHGAGDGPGAGSYVLYRRVLPHGKMSELAAVERSGERTSFVDAGVEPGLQYRYRVAGVNSAGEGAMSFAVDLVVPGERLEAPSDLAAVYTAQGMELTWGAPTNAATTHYQVYRGKFRGDGGAHDGAVSKHAEIPAGGDPMTYLDTGVEAGAKYRYRVAAVNATGEGLMTTWLDIQATSSDTDTNSPATGAPAIDGAARVGETLAAAVAGIVDADGLTGAVFGYQWVRNNSTTGGTDIAGATGAAYTLTELDEGHTITVDVSFTDDAGHPETVTSDPTTAVAPKPNSPATGAPAINGAARVGETLAAAVAGIVDADGLAGAVFDYQWIRNNSTTGGTDIAGATGAAYTLTELDEGHTITVDVSFTDDAGHPETVTSDPTTAVAPETVPPDKPGKPQDLEGEASAQAIALTWKAPEDSTVAQYVVYRAVLHNGRLNGRPMTKYTTVDATGAAMAYTDDDVEEGVDYRYRVAAANSAGEGKKSNWLDIEAKDPPKPKTEN